MIVTAHQPDFLPYSGFWYKMAKADVMDIKIYDQFVDKGYQRRVKMRDKWTSIPVVGGPSVRPIKDVRIDPVKTSPLLRDQIVGRYRGARYWKDRGPAILDMVTDIHTDRLWQLNFELIVGVRDFLGITTPVAIGVQPVGTRNAGVISALQVFPVTTYLSGTGARTYMGDCQEYDDANISVRFSAHKPVTGDSILSVIFDYSDPMSVVLAELDDESSLEVDPLLQEVKA